jgi:hypothetical protein
MAANVDALVGKYDEPGTYVVTGVAELSDALRVGYYRAQDGKPRALALSLGEYIRARDLLELGAKEIEVVRG